MSKSIAAQELSGLHMDKLVTFAWKFDGSKVHADVTGALMEVHHDGQGVWLNLTAANGEGSGEKTEFRLDALASVEVH